MPDNGQREPRRRTWQAIFGAALLVVLPFLADVSGLFGFITGKALPDLFSRSEPKPAVSAGLSSGPTTSSGAPKRIAKAPVTDKPSRSERPLKVTSKKPESASGGDVVKNFQLSVSPPVFDAAAPRSVLIETWDGKPGAFVDVEIADPGGSGGVCPKLTAGPCNLLYSGGDQADARGRSRVAFRWFGNEPGHDGIHHPGTYTVTVQDRGTGTKLSLDFTAE
jgi:hypothetical protein